MSETDPTTPQPPAPNTGEGSGEQPPAPNNQPEGTDGTPANTDGNTPPTNTGGSQPPKPDEGSSGNEPSFLEKLFTKNKKTPEDNSFIQEFEKKLEKDREVAANQAKQLEHLQNGVLSKELAEEAFQAQQSTISALQGELDTMKQSFNTFKEELSQGKGFPSGQNPFTKPVEKIDHAKLQEKRQKLF